MEQTECDFGNLKEMNSPLSVEEIQKYLQVFELSNLSRQLFFLWLLCLGNQWKSESLGS